MESGLNDEKNMNGMREARRTELAERLVPIVPRHIEIATKKHPVRAVAFQLASRTALSWSLIEI
jgi:hypothetical protein